MRSDIHVIPSLLTTALLTAASWAPLTAQAVPVVQLGRAEAEYAEPFDQVTAVRELSDGRVVVADRFAKAVSLVDMKRGTATAIGREGQGPGEFAMPWGLVALPGDTTLVIDPPQSRLLVVPPSGKPSGTLALPVGGPTSLMTVRGADRQGRLYLQAPRFTGQIPQDGNLPDSVALLRWDRASSKVDTLGRIKVPSMSMATGGSGNTRSFMMRQQPLTVQDDWSVAPDGRVGVVRVGNYHIGWIGAQRVAGPAVAYKPVPVTQADKDELARRMSDSRGAMRMTVGGPPRGGAAAPPRAPRPVDDADWPAVKPPFVEQTTMATPDGSLWVRRSQPQGAPALYDVFDAQGRLTRQVALGKDMRVVGFGAASVYVARTDEDDLQYLVRFKRPA